MRFRKHSDLEGKHAFLSPSNYHWVNYSDDKFDDVYLRHTASLRGSELHDLACRCIKLGVKLPKDNKPLGPYVNDAIKFKMIPEQTLYYSDNCFGTADSISFNNDILRIHDLKTGSIKASGKQLEVYAAIFCLEYGIEPEDMKKIELRIYQLDKINTYHPASITIRRIMDRIVEFDDRIEEHKLQSS